MIRAARRWYFADTAAPMAHAPPTSHSNANAGSICARCVVRSMPSRSAVATVADAITASTTNAN
jgi:hypothetical protein